MTQMTQTSDLELLFINRVILAMVSYMVVLVTVMCLRKVEITDAKQII